MTIYNTKTIEGRLLSKQSYDDLVSQGAIINLSKELGKRTSLQSRTRWLYLTMVANDLNNRGLTYRVTKKLECRFTKELLYEVYWQPLKNTMFPETKRMNTHQFWEVAEMSILLFAEIYQVKLKFPNRDDMMREDQLIKAQAKKSKP